MDISDKLPNALGEIRTHLADGNYFLMQEEVDEIVKYYKDPFLWLCYSKTLNKLNFLEVTKYIEEMDLLTHKQYMIRYLQDRDIFLDFDFCLILEKYPELLI